MSLRYAMAVAATAVMASACGISPAAAPTDVPVGERSLAIGADTSAGIASGESEIYLVTGNDPRQLRSVNRDAGTRLALLEAVIAGPTEDESAALLSSALPPDTSVNAVRQVGTVLYIDLSPDIADLSGDGLLLAVAQLVHTADRIDGIETVQLTVADERFPWPRSDGGTTTGLLRTYDFPGLAVSSQPAYPPLPNPS
ncbi:MAG: GerMN domain-containing protein [Ilumatobacteraceae bacterium]